jgi:hypothetical protein
MSTDRRNFFIPDTSKPGLSVCLQRLIVRSVKAAFRLSGDVFLVLVQLTIGSLRNLQRFGRQL